MFSDDAVFFTLLGLIPVEVNTALAFPLALAFPSGFFLVISVGLIILLVDVAMVVLTKILFSS
jgi:hypothetical protein